MPQPSDRRPRVDAPVVDTAPDADEMTVEQVAAVLDRTEDGVRYAVRTGALPAVRRPMVGRPGKLVYWVRAADVARYQQYISLRPFPMGRPKGLTEASF